MRILIVIFFIGTSISINAQNWIVDKQADWLEITANTQGVELLNGQAKSSVKKSTFTSKIHSYKTKKKAQSITFKQSSNWDNWKEVPNVGPEGTLDAIVLIPIKENDYWLLARKYDTHPKRVDVTRLTHSDDELGYHAWHSTDMKSWKHYGPVSGYRERWVTTAEYKNGAFYIYYDHPNDEDPHLIIDNDLTDGKMGKDMGMVFNDPSHGSDCAIFRDEDNSFHLIYENWDPINAQTHSWDSPLGGHAVSPDGIHDFKILSPVVDHRTKPTGKYGEYIHGSIVKEVKKYEIHEPEQKAYGDWTAIKVGGQYYLFCDYHPVGERIKIGCFTSGDINKQFSFIGEMGNGHPDPTIGFAEGQFYLLQQQGKVDFVSPGPWVPGVKTRVGVDISGNGKIDEWTDWQEIKESYSLKQGFSRIVDTVPAKLVLTGLPEGYGFCFEYKTETLDFENANIVIEKVQVDFK
ncbi:glycoside hydrolase family protein [Lutibacter citreus]|uniref:hypothetical protein n=1 Tax=Lutibacter citreus TaxID=2138210 RepID=UPI000DBE3D8E|nr:hypothetical protein [Lutibacter citreus]